MPEKKINKFLIPRSYLFLLPALAIFGIVLYFLQLYYPPAVDWEYSFSPLSEHWRNPYVIRTFTMPPWVTFLVPHAWLPLSWGNAINLSLNITVILALVRRYNGGWQTLLLVFTSPPFFDLARTNNIDWIPMLAFLIPPAWGLPLLAIKPQSMGASALIWWKREKFRWQMLLPLVLVLGISLFVWGNWIVELGLIDNIVWNFAPWPLGIPLGVYMLVRAYKKDDVILAAVATPFLVPYIAPYSITALFALAGGKYRREVFIVYIAFWVFVIVESRRIALM